MASPKGSEMATVTPPLVGTRQSTGSPSDAQCLAVAKAKIVLPMVSLGAWLEKVCCGFLQVHCLNEALPTTIFIGADRRVG